MILLLFEVGLESTVSQMMQVGASSVLVAALGVAAPFALGWLVGAWLMPESSVYVHLFLGATLTATSVGITARVLEGHGPRAIPGSAGDPRRRGRGRRDGARHPGGGDRARGRRGQAPAPSRRRQVADPLVKATVFLAGFADCSARCFSRRLFPLAARLRSRGVLLAFGLSFCFLLSWLSDWMGLAPIVGAFAAGLLLEDTHYQEFVDRGERGLEDLVHPITSFLAPVFFVLMGIRTDLAVLLRAPRRWRSAGRWWWRRSIGKQACSLGVIGGGIDRLSVGIGMIPRGEVGLIFANVGLGLLLNGQPLVSTAEFSAVVVMVIVTTLMTPPLLTWSFGRRRG